MMDYQDVRITAVPYDSGHRGLRMGAGPEHLLANGLGEELRTDGRRPGVVTINHGRMPAVGMGSEDLPSEIGISGYTPDVAAS